MFISINIILIIINLTTIIIIITSIMTPLKYFCYILPIWDHHDESSKNKNTNNELFKFVSVDVFSIQSVSFKHMIFASEPTRLHSECRFERINKREKTTFVLVVEFLILQQVMRFAIKMSNDYYVYM